MRIYVLHDCYEETEFYAEANVIEVSSDEKKLYELMKLAYMECKESHPDANEESYIDSFSALVTEESEGYYYKHQWMIDEFEV